MDRRLYLALRRWIDARLSEPGMAGSRLLVGCGFVPLWALMALEAVSDPPRWLWAAALALSLGWFGFVGWRAYRIVRATAIKGDRTFDRDTKYRIPEEYRSSESVLAARLRGRRDRR